MSPEPELGTAGGGPADDELDDDDLEGDDLEGDEDAADPNRLPAPMARAVLEHIVRAIVDDPDAVEIEIGSGRRATALNVHVAPGDMGRVIGKRGRTAGAIRTVVRAAAARDGTDVEVDFVD